MRRPMARAGGGRRRPLEPAGHAAESSPAPLKALAGCTPLTSQSAAGPSVLRRLAACAQPAPRPQPPLPTPSSSGWLPALDRADSAAAAARGRFCCACRPEKSENMVVAGGAGGGRAGDGRRLEEAKAAVTCRRLLRALSTWRRAPPRCLSARCPTGAGFTGQDAGSGRDSMYMAGRSKAVPIRKGVAAHSKRGAHAPPVLRLLPTQRARCCSQAKHSRRCADRRGR